MQKILIFCFALYVMACTPLQEVNRIGRELYNVGSKTIFVHDQRAYDSVGGIHDGVRTLISEIWYPVLPESITARSLKATYADYVFSNKRVFTRLMTQTNFQNLTPASVRDGVTQADIEAAIDELFDRERDSYVNVPIALGFFPVVVLSHGDGGSRMNMQSLAEHLAINGYIVIAPDHTGNSPYAMTGADPALSEPAHKKMMAAVIERLDKDGVYGKPATLGQSYTPQSPAAMSMQSVLQLDAALIQRVNDLRAVLASLDSLNGEGEWKGHLDMTRVGLLGRSFGAATTLAALGLESQFKAGVAVVPPSLPDMRKVLPEEMLRHGESAILAKNTDHPMTNFSRPTMLITGDEDALIMSLSRQMVALGAPEPTMLQRHPLVYKAFLDSALPVVYAEIKNTNHGSLGDSAPYWWPSLKPDSFARFFMPEQRYKLLDANIAHQIQQDSVVHFFDAFVKEEASAKQALHLFAANNDALSRWELRNF